ncbi:hypothetical protein HMSSN139_19630 [Paenibacillus sp. HMSSN-139]|nr:hypothetical protein HMSSN139_19630 [Paenibacillus sp. HMSSN-139]
MSIYTGDLIDFKRALIETSREAIAVMNHQKFGQTALRTFAALSEISRIITDRGLSPEAAEPYERAGVMIEFTDK